MINNNDRIQHEKEFHENRFRGKDSRESLLKYYSISKLAIEKYRNLIVTNCSDKSILEYGIGDGYTALYWLKYGAIVTGIDISNEAVTKSNKLIKFNL